MPKAKRILVHRLGSLGDFCVALPALRIVRQTYPEAEITLLTNLPVSLRAAPAPALLDGMGLVDSYLAYPVGTRNPLTLGRLVWYLRRRQYEAVVNLTAWRGAPALRRDAQFFRWCRIPRLIGFGPKETGGLRVDGVGRSEYEAERLLRRVSQLGHADLNDRRWYDLNLTADELHLAQTVLHHGGAPSAFLAISVGSKLFIKDWEQPRWIQLLAALTNTLERWGCIAVGAKDEMDRTDECLRAWRGPTVNLCGILSPRESAAALARADIFIGHDSGPMHLAAAVGTRCVAIFSARNPPGQWYPLGPGHTVLFRRIECTGCGLDECVVEQKRCIRSITVDEVVTAVRRQLGRVRDHESGSVGR